MIDVVTNAAGAAIGIVLATRFRSIVTIRPGAGGPLFLLCCWMCALLFPFMPDLSVYHLNLKLLQFVTPPFSAVAFFSLLVTWLAAMRLMEAAVDRYVVPLLLFILPLRLLVSGLTLAWTDCVPALMALFIYFIWPHKSPRRDAILAGLSIAAILLTGLSPFHFSGHAQDFGWIPFRALFTTDWEGGFAIFFRKSFAYGSAVWLVMSAGVSLFTAAVSVATLLAGLELVQQWLPNHVAEATDPLHVLILSWILHRLRPAASRAATETKENASVRL
jgi:hypothetical protein